MPQLKHSQSNPPPPSILRSIDDCTHSLLAYIEDGNDDQLFHDAEDAVDLVKLERLRRAEMQSRRMSVQQYMEFSEARGVSFGKKAKVSFRN